MRLETRASIVVCMIFLSRIGGISEHHHQLNLSLLLLN